AGTGGRRTVERGAGRPCTTPRTAWCHKTPPPLVDETQPSVEPLSRAEADAAGGGRAGPLQIACICRRVLTQALPDRITVAFPHTPKAADGRKASRAAARRGRGFVEQSRISVMMPSPPIGRSFGVR